MYFIHDPNTHKWMSECTNRQKESEQEENYNEICVEKVNRHENNEYNQAASAARCN